MGRQTRLRVRDEQRRFCFDGSSSIPTPSRRSRSVLFALSIANSDERNNTASKLKIQNWISFIKMVHGCPKASLLTYCIHCKLRHLASFVRVMVDQMLSKNQDISGYASAELALGEDARKIHFPS